MENQILRDYEEKYTLPSRVFLEDLSKIDGDFIFLGIGGKMGPSMAKLLIDGLKKIGVTRKVYGVSRFSDAEGRQYLEDLGVETISCDLLDDEALQKLPEVKNVIYLAGFKFGAVGKEDFTWAMNSYLPGRVADKFKNSRIVALSSGNVLPFVNVTDGGVDETVCPEPIGEYAQSTLGRERIFTYFSKKNNTPILIYRLNYAVDFRYGVVREIAKQVFNNQPIDITTNNVNVIWQSDANEIAIRSLLHTEAPAKVLNVTGPEILSIKWIAQKLALAFGKEVEFVGVPETSALLNNASECHKIFGYPSVSILEIIDITAKWMLHGGDEFGKDTHFQERKGKF
ncbi:NAD-dependent epimerase/dehydratase family protein [Sphingobacterium rhinopitheci]|uniref:NAD-dependent epimerase/dehydratase family protein n=1 Tax=Sphingobacterium rhinopitheci TaxID=2781960 RepID=UPI001F5240B0|nr:NAD(P)-dependent oxidoreductase [Sphingobacterium rhinopitheci]MCI0920131.1 NAD(P)-dependent oxidoreductase [Sphingobacterium rhinopitheci]